MAFQLYVVDKYVLAVFYVTKTLQSLVFYELKWAKTKWNTGLSDTYILFLWHCTPLGIEHCILGKPLLAAL